MYRDHDPYAVLMLLVLQHLQYGTGFVLTFKLRTVLLVLNHVLKLFYCELSIIVKPYSKRLCIL
jgi:hypothetical protein